MKIRKLTLYKTSLDNEYHNVIDAGKDKYLNATTYKTEILDNNYSPLVIYNNDDGIKCVYENTGECEVAIAKEYQNIMSGGYNYACIENDEMLFYFITGMESLNDSSTPSMAIHLERDSWANNIEYFSNKEYDDKQNVVRSHFERIIDNGDNTFKSNYLLSTDMTNFTQFETMTPLNIGSGGNVIWCGVRFSLDTIYSGNFGGGIASLLNLAVPDTVDDRATKIGTIASYVATGNWLLSAAVGLVLDNADDVSATLDAMEYKTIRDKGLIGASPYEAGAPAFYFPVAIITGVNDGVPNYNYVFSMNAGGSSFSYNFTSTGTIVSAFSFEAEEILDAFLTLTPPFSYTVSGSTINVTSNVAVSTQKLKNSLGTDIIFPFNLPGTATDNFGYITSCLQSSAHTDLYYNYSSPMDNFTAKGTIGTKFFDPYASYEDVYIYEPRLYCYPFTSLYFQMGQVGEEIPIQYDRTNVKVTIANGNKSEPNASVFLNNNLISAYKNIGCPGKMATSYDKWKEFTLGQIVNLGSSVVGTTPPSSSSSTRTYYKNGTPREVKRRVKTDKGQHRLVTTLKDTGFTDQGADITRTSHSGGNVLHNLAGATMNAVSEGVQITGRATQPNMPSVFANNNIEVQIPFIVKRQFSSFYEIDDLLGELYMYGYKHGSAKSVKENCRIWFDYCETSGCSLPRIKNSYDRKKLEWAFDRGVTKWHWNEGFGLNPNFSRDRNNVESKYVQAIDAQIYFDFTQTNGRALINKGTIGTDYKFVLSDGATTDSNGLHITADSGNSAILDISSAGIFPSSGTYVRESVAFRFDDIDTTNGIDLYYPNLGYGSGVLTTNRDSTGTIWLFNGAQSDRSINTGLTYQQIQGKCLQISCYGLPGYSTATQYSVFLDGELVKSGTTARSFCATVSNKVSFGYGGTIYNNNYATYNVKKYAAWIETGVSGPWTADEALTHQI